MTGGTLNYRTGPGESNNVTMTLVTGGDVTVLGNVALTAGTGCTPGADANSATCTGATFIDAVLGDLGDTITISGLIQATITGGAGSDNVTGGTAGDDINVRGPGPDTVSCTGDDVVGADSDDAVTGPECQPDLAPVTGIFGDPNRFVNDATPELSFYLEQNVDGVTGYECRLDGAAEGCQSSPFTPQVPLNEGAHTFQVTASDSYGPGPTATLNFTVDTIAPQVNVTGPQTSTTATPAFELSASETLARFECWIGSGTPEPCASPYTTSALPNGSYVLLVRGTDRAGNATTTTFPFAVQVPPGGSPPPSVQPRRIIIESLVLISGRPVKMSRRGVVSIGLQCAGTKRCKGRMTITTAEPVSRKRKKLEHLGSTRFSIAANKKRRVKVDFSKSKTKLARRLKRFKAKVVITEVDQRGNARVSSRVFVLRAR